MSTFRRRPFFHLNDYEKHVLYGVVLPCYLGLFVILGILDYLYWDKHALLHNIALSSVKQSILLGLIALSLLFCLLFFIAFRIINRIIGAHDRIIRELDEIIYTHERKHLTVRKDDTLYQEIVDRINRLLER